MRTGIPTGTKSEFAAPNVALEMFVCTRFWRWIDRNRLNAESGIRESKIAISTPMIDVFGVTPIVVSICNPMIEPTTERPRVSTSVAGSAARGCFPESGGFKLQ